MTNRTRLAAFPLMLILLAGCADAAGSHRSAGRSPVGACSAPPLDATGRVAAAAVRWQVRSADADRRELDEWCRGVGAPVIVGAADGVTHADSVAIITWNIHVGAARVDAFVADLRSGVLTGRPIEHFVLLVQEARRAGADVPQILPDDGRGTRRLGPPDGGEEGDIVAIAERLGLRLFYAPSMRNGGREHAAEDRGNAILTTLPLTEPTAIELPLLAQRRVAVAATIPVVDGRGQRRELRVSSVHLDYGASRSRLLAPFGGGRTLQAGALAHALGDATNAVVGGDFNTWLADWMEGGLSLMNAVFPDFPGGRTEPTHYTGGVWPRWLDHLFLRGGDVLGSEPRRIDQLYGSDHYPVMAWVRFAGDLSADDSAAPQP